MKAAVLHEYGPPSVLKYEDFDDPTPGPGEVLIRVSSISINPVDWKMRSGAAKERFPVNFPGILGRDLSGIVRAVGEKVTDFAPGDKVFAFTPQTYAELAVVKAEHLAHLPEGLDLIEAAALPLVVATGEQLITRAAKVQQGQTILVSGALGSVGRVAVLVAKKAGATVIAGVRKSQKEAASSLGADQVLALDDPHDLDQLGLIDAIANTVASPTREALLAKVKQGGIFASVVGPPTNAALHPTITIAPIMAEPDPAKLVEIAHDVLAHRLVIPIDRMLPLSDAAEGHAAAEKGGLGKILLLA